MTVRRQARVLGEALDAADLLARLEAERRAKRNGGRDEPIGFGWCGPGARQILSRFRVEHPGGRKESIGMLEGCWIEPTQVVHDLGRLTHDEWAREWLERHAVVPTRKAKQAAVVSRPTKPDAGPAFFELLRRGWVRQRGNVFTVWQVTPRVMESVQFGAVRSGFSTARVEVRNDREVLEIGALRMDELVDSFELARPEASKERRH